ncbi:MAG: hypothetical protein RLZZ226_1968 [Pseudomonadota bacterium]
MNYLELKPTYSIWLLGERINKDKRYLRNYKLRDQKGELLLDNGGIWILELPKFDETTVTTELDRWLKLFKVGDQLDDTRLPDWMQTPEMEQVMAVLNRFSEKEYDYHIYQTRQNYLREQKTIQLELEEALREKEAERQAKEEALQKEQAERQAKEAERKAKEEALHENESMKAELAKLRAELDQARKK